MSLPNGFTLISKGRRKRSNRISRAPTCLRMRSFKAWRTRALSSRSGWTAASLICVEKDDRAISSFKSLVDSGGIELIGAPYYRTLSCFLGSFREFKRIVHAHQRALSDLFGYTPSTFANTCLVHNSRIGHIIKGMGFSRAIVNGEGLKPQFGYRTEGGIMALPVHPQLSSDIGTRFSDKKWSCYPLSAGTYASWVSHAGGDLAVIYVDYGAFGAIHDKESGIFQFLRVFAGSPGKKRRQPDHAVRIRGRRGGIFLSHGLRGVHRERPREPHAAFVF